MAYLSQAELPAVGLRSCGTDVRISRSASLYHPERIELGDHVRIDDYAIISGSSVESGFVRIGSRIHISAYCQIDGAGGVILDDFSGLSVRCTIFSESDDYSGESLTNPTVPMQLRGVEKGLVHLGRHVIIGAGTVILPGTTIGDGSAVGAMSLARGALEPGFIYVGVPARRIKARSARLFELEKLLSDESPT